MVQKPEQYRDRNRRRHLKSFAYSVGLWQKSCEKTSLYPNEMVSVSRRFDLHPFPMHFLMGTHCFPFHSYDLKIKFGSRQREAILQTPNRDREPISRLWYLLDVGPNHGQNLFPSEPAILIWEELTLPSQENLQDSERARHNIKPWGRWDKKMYPLKHIGDKSVSSLLRDCKAINQSGWKWEDHHSF